MTGASGPTQTTDGSSTRARWAARPGLARAARIAVALAPIVISILFSLIMSRLLPPHRLGINRWLWLLGLACLTTLVLAHVDRIVRRFAPLAALLQLSLVFPDEAPSRYRTAMRSFSARKVQARLDGVRAAGFRLRPDELRSQTMLDLLGALSDHDRLTRGHSERVRAYSEMIGRELELSDDEIDRLQWASLLHDLGKLAVPSVILNKDGRPDEAEWRVLQGHPAAGLPLAEPILEWLGDFASAIDQHHERWDGNGYPHGLAGAEIPLPARIVAVADAYDVMTSARSYKKAFSADVAREEVAAGAGSQFCPTVARAFLALPTSRLRAVAGPLSWMGGLPGLQNVPVAEVVGSSTVGIASATLTAVTATAMIPGLLPTAASAEETPPPPTTAVAAVTTTTSTTTSLPEEPADLTVEIPLIPLASPEPQPAAPPPSSTPVASPTSTTTPTSTTLPPTTSTTLPTTTTTTTTTVPPTTSTTVAPTTTTTTPPNRDPSAQSDAATVLEGATTVIDVLSNDADPDAGDIISVQSATAGSNGTVSVGGDGTVTYVHDGSETTADSFTYVVRDVAGATDSGTVAITVTPRNDRPSAVSAGDPAPVLEESGPQTIAAWATALSTGGETGQTLTFDVVSNDFPGLFAAPPAVDPVSGDLTFTPSTDRSGVADVVFVVRDDGGTANGGEDTSEPLAVRIAVVDVNDEPTFTPGGTQDVEMNSGAASVPWATSIRRGPADESAQVLSFDVVADTPSLFSVQPTVDPSTGALSFTPAADVSGTSDVTIILRDDGGTANGGDDTSSPVITVISVYAEDHDAVPLVGDNCPSLFNPMQSDTDGDGVGDECDPTPTVPSAGTYTDSGQRFAANKSRFVVLGDVDGDGDLDAVFANESDPSKVWLNDGAGTFSDSGQALAATSAVAAVLADVDGDGDADLLFGHDAGVPNTVWRNDGSGTFTDTGQGLGSNDTHDMAVGDVDGDGDLDLLTANHGQGNKIYLNDGSGTFTDSGHGGIAAGTTGIDVADVDADGDLDLLYANEGGISRIWTNDGTGSFSITPQSLASGLSISGHFADVDGDGDLDVTIVSDNDAGTVWLNDGTGLYSDSGQAIGPAHHRHGAVGDVDGDGDLDLVVADHLDPNAVWTNGGAGIFTDSAQLLDASATEAVALGDLDGDGDLDAVYANYNAANQIWFNS